jgi:Phage tail protein
VTVLDLGPYGYLRHDPAAAYLFGPPGAPTLALNTVDADGVQWWCDEPEGWAAPAAVTPVDGRSYGDGGYAGATTYEPRTLTFGSSEPAVAVAPDAATAAAAYRRLLAVVASRTGVLFTAPDWAGPASLWLRASGQPKVRWYDGGRVFEFTAVMVAEDPLKFDATEAAAPRTAALPVPPTGILWPLHWPAVWGTGGTDTALVITNRGDEDAQAVYTITGPVDRPQVVNATTGLWFTINRALGDGDTVEVDTRAATVYHNGVSIFGDLTGDFAPLAPGTNTVRWAQLAGERNDTARLTVATASTWK